ncbi:Hypothetical predicted protein [Octopus vulgaris]|uniref:Uncharacterized protein n=1 Tax=Octopus vulgaris TaxID=6645 RepID=A0AA36AQ39_OCTVU|nr:Hypothetical predicted protein [Octopus vulgaris]
MCLLCHKSHSIGESLLRPVIEEVLSTVMHEKPDISMMIPLIVSFPFVDERVGVLGAVGGGSSSDSCGGDRIDRDYDCVAVVN